MIFPMEKYRHIRPLDRHNGNGRLIRSILIIHMMMMMILTLYDGTTTFYVTAFTSSSSRYSLVKSLPSNSLRQQQQQPRASHMFLFRNDSVTTRKQFRAALSPLKRHSTPKTMLFSSNPYYPFLNVALDQPLYHTPIRQYFTENFLLRHVNVALKSVMGFLPVLLHSFQNMALSNKTMTLRLIKYAFLCFTLLMCSKFIWKSTDRLTSVASTRTSPSTARTTTTTTTKEAVPMPFDPNINEGWSVCKLQSIVPYGPKMSQNLLKPTASPYLFLTMALPQSNYVLPLQLGQTIHVCGLDRNGNARQAEFYPFVDPTRAASPAGTFALLVPNPSRYTNRYDDSVTVESDETSDVNNNSNKNDLQQLRVVQLLQDYMKTGDTEIAIHPGITSKLQYRGSHYPVTEIVYFVIGSTGIVPVLDQVSTVLTSSATAQTSGGSGVERVSMVWITSCIEEFDTLSHSMKQMYEKYSTQLAVTCGVETSLQSSMTQEIASDYFFENNVEINDSVPTFQPGMAAIISIEGLPHTSTSLLRQGAVKYLERQRGFPPDCICVL